ncbi:MAG: dTMP kinase [Terriglobia bacterium]
MKSQGIFITLEGIDGTGKSTQLRLLAAWLRRKGYHPLITREPGGTRVGEQIRGVLLASANRKLTAVAELLLMYAARHQHLEEVVRLALRRGELVLSDRFNDASFAYQGFGRKLGNGPVRMLDDLVCGSTQPGLTLILDAPPQLAGKRARGRSGDGKYQRFENAGLQFQASVRKGYLEIARRDPDRVKIVRADRPVVEVQEEVRRLVEVFLARLRTYAPSRPKTKPPGSREHQRSFKS